MTWNLVAVVVCAITFALMMRHLLRMDDLPTQFAVTGLWVRMSLAAFPEITAIPSIGPMSINAVFSILVTLGALALIDARLLRLRYAFSFYPLLAIILASGLVNRMPGGAIEYAMRYLFLFGLALLIYRGVRIFGPQAMLRAILCAISTPIILQYMSVLFGKYKFSEEDGSISYIGGYIHEGPFSQLLLGFLFVAAMVQWRSRFTGIALVVLAMVGILLSNYRTSIIGALPVLGLLVARATLASAPRGLREGLFALGVGVVVIVAMSYDALLPPRYADLARFDEVLKLISQPTIYFNDAQRDLFNYRAFLWAQYIGVIERFDASSWLLGLGPISWRDNPMILRDLSAHNTLLSWLFQFGLIGMIGMASFLVYNLFVAATAADRALGMILAACLAGFMLVGLATEPLWAMEGVVNYAMLLGLAWGFKRSAEAPPPLPPVPAQPRRAPF